MEFKKEDCRDVFLRLWTIAESLKNGDTFTKAEIMEKFEVSSRTFFRDIDFLRIRMGFNIRYDKWSGRYILKKGMYYAK